MSKFELIKQWELTPEEKSYLKTHSCLFEKWGYRTGAQEQHERFEEKSHEPEARIIQRFTDPLFRNLEQIIRGKSSGPYQKETSDKYKDSCADWIDSAALERGITILQNFQTGNYQTRMSLSRLGHLELTSKNTLGMAVIVTSARAILLLSNRRVDDAKQCLKNLLDFFPN